MTRRARRPWLGLVLALVVAAPGCKYGSVKTAGDVATTLPEHVPVLRDAGLLCRLEATTSAARDATPEVCAARPDEPATPRFDPCHCDRLEANQEIFARAARELASYGLALKELAGVGDIPAADLVSGLIAVGDIADIADLDDDQRTAIDLSVRILVDVFANGYKKYKLRKAVKRTDRAVQCLVRRQLINAEALAVKLEGLKLDLDNDFEDAGVILRKLARTPEDEEVAPAADAEPVSPAMVKLEDEVSRVDRASARARRDANETRRTLARDGLLTVARELRRLSALRRGLRAFAVAHNRLACDPKKIGTLRDGKLTGAIRESIRCATLIGEDAPPECEYVADALEKIGQCDDVDRPEPICVW